MTRFAVNCDYQLLKHKNQLSWGSVYNTQAQLILIVEKDDPRVNRHVASARLEGFLMSETTEPGWIQSMYGSIGAQALTLLEAYRYTLSDDTSHDGSCRGTTRIYYFSPMCQEHSDDIALPHPKSSV